MNVDEELQRGDMASAVLENPIYAESWELVRNGIIAAWENAPIRDKEGQNELKLMLKVLGDVRKAVEQTMNTGKMARIQIEQESAGEMVMRMFGKKR